MRLVGWVFYVGNQYLYELNYNSQGRARVSLDEVFADARRSPLGLGFFILLPVPPPNNDMFPLWSPSWQSLYWVCPGDQIRLAGAVGARPLDSPKK